MAGSNGQAPKGMFERFVHSEVTSSFVLIGCTLLALAWANSRWAETYFHLAHTKVGVSWGDAAFELSLHHWVNDGLMVIFFFVVGLEIKREVVVGQLSTPRLAVLPVAAAIGGMVVPAILYAALNAGGEGGSGWGIPMATDIAFALGILALFGKRAPLGLKVFLTALAIADDLGAVLVIAVFYTAQLRVGALVAAAVFLALVLVAVRAGQRRLGTYVFLAIAVWFSVFASGVHATIAGILVAMVIPVRTRRQPAELVAVARRRIEQLDDGVLTQDSMVRDRSQLAAIMELGDATLGMTPPGLALEKYLHPVQAFLILPLFAFFNAGVTLDAESVSFPPHRVSLGIVLGLVVGKQVGVLLASWLAVKSGRADLPEGVGWSHIYGASCLAGVGFTMSLFIGELAFTDPGLVADAKIGILVASLISGVLGFLVLRRATRE